MDHIQRLNAYAQDGNIEGLYAVIGVDPHVLEGIDKIPFVETPLHVAVSAGQVHFAIEIFSLKPSFGRKLNPNGLSPLHLAVPSGLAEPLTLAQQAETAIRLINIDRELIRVQGRGRMTPLHYAAESNKFDLVAEFLCSCPLSIEDLTIRGETALHVAVRNGSFKTSEVILGWHRKIDERFNWTYIPYQFLLRETYKGVLRWKNEDGDTALHIAASTNQPKVVKLLMNRVYMNDKNLQNSTPLDSGYQHQEVKEILMSAGASRGATISNSSASTSLADFMSDSLFHVLHRGLSGDMGNVVLVVAVLTATATFQVPRTGMTTILGHRIIARSIILDIALVLNSVAFFSSVGVIAFTLRNSFVTQLLKLCLFFVTLTYLSLVASLISTADAIAPRVAFGMCVCVYFSVLYAAIVRRVFQSKSQIMTFSKISIGRCNPSGFFEMRRQMVGW